MSKDPQPCTPGTSSNGKTALVTGASGALGRDIVLALARDGASVAIAYNSRPEPAEDLARQVEAVGAKAMTVQADLAEPSGMTALFDRVVEGLGSLDVLIANAGVPSNQPFDSFTAEDFDAVFSINARGLFFLLQEGARRVPDGGRIINISSSQSLHPATGFAVYAASKAAGERFVATLAIELGARAVTCNSVVVGPINGGFLERAPQEERDRLAAETSLGRLGRSQEIGAVVAFLASDAASLITGQSIVADGGVLRL